MEMLEWDHFFQCFIRIGLCVGLKILFFQANEVVGFSGLSYSFI